MVVVRSARISKFGAILFTNAIIRSCKINGRGERRRRRKDGKEKLKDGGGRMGKRREESKNKYLLFSCR